MAVMLPAVCRSSGVAAQLVLPCDLFGRHRACSLNMGGQVRSAIACLRQTRFGGPGVAHARACEQGFHFIRAKRLDGAGLLLLTSFGMETRRAMAREQMQFPRR